MELVRKRKYSLNDFLSFIHLLRSPKGCSWDKSKTHSSIRSELIEEVYEAVEAIDLNDSEMLKEELGDLLVQIAFHCGIEEEIGNFSFEDIVDAACRKIIVNHPHVFSNSVYRFENPRRFYEPSEYGGRFRSGFSPRNYPESPAEGVKKVSKILPSLMRTAKVQDRAARAGYGLFSVEEAINETFEKLHYLETLILEGKCEDYARELGDLLFSVTEVSRLVNVDAESALYDSCERFKDEFLYKISLEKRNKV